MTQRDGRPQEFGPYRVLRRIGEGGMGVVYLAVDSAQRQVAVKALRPAVAGERDARRRLAREVETMRRVHSPYVAEVLDADLSCEPPYIVTQYVRGRTLDQLVNESGPLNGPALARLARGSTAALCAVHAAGVVHRDLKPGNIMLSEGEPVVIDFGIAHAADSSKITQTGMFMGTPGYLAPEVIEGKGATQASDVHSWGSTIAFAATGRPPFGTGSFEVIFYRIMNGSPDLAGCPAALVGLLTAALARDPLRRPSAEQLAARLGVMAPADLRPGRAAAQGSAARGRAAGDAPAGEPGGAGASPDLPAAGVPGAAPAGLAAAAAAAAAAASAASPLGSGATVSPDAVTIDPVPLPVSATVADAARPAWAGGKDSEDGADAENAATQRGADDQATDEGVAQHAPSNETGDSGPAGPEPTAAGVLAGSAAAGAAGAAPPDAESAGPAAAGLGSAGAGAAGSAAAGLASAGAGAAAGAADPAGAAAAGLGADAAAALAAGAAAAASGPAPASAGDGDFAGSGRGAGSGPAVDRSATRVTGQAGAPAANAVTDPAGPAPEDRSATRVPGAAGPAAAGLSPAVDRSATRLPGQGGPAPADPVDRSATRAPGQGGPAGPGSAAQAPGATPGLAPGGGGAAPGGPGAAAAAAAGAAAAGAAGAGSATVTNVPGGGSGYPGAGAAGLAGAGLAGAGLGGAGHDPHLDLASSPAAAAAAARLNQTQPMPIVRDPSHGSLSDLLPDVQYGPPASGRRQGPPSGPYDPNATGIVGGPYDPQAGPNRAAQYGLAKPAPVRGQHLFVALLVLAGAGITVVAPVAGSVIALTALLALRAGDLTRNWAARRRAKRGAAAAMSAMVYPLMLVWSGITMIALAPVALVAAGIAVTITILAVPAHPFVQAAAFATGAAVLCYGLGPGSSAPRRQLGRMYAAMARSPGSTAVVLFFTGVLCLAALAAAFSQLPFYWPLEHLRFRIDHWQPLRDLAHTLRTTLTSWYHQILG